MEKAYELCTKELKREEKASKFVKSVHVPNYKLKKSVNDDEFLERAYTLCTHELEKLKDE